MRARSAQNGRQDCSSNPTFGTCSGWIPARPRSGRSWVPCSFSFCPPWSSSDAKVVTVTPAGRLLAVGNGSATVTVVTGGVSKSVPVTVAGVSDKPAVGFVEHVMPVLSKAGCNAGACHASQYGKGGFKLSVFASEPYNDHPAITRAYMRRRINPMDPPRSLLLLKATAAIPHGGGRRLQPDSVDVRILEQWIAAGAPMTAGRSASVQDLEVWPSRRVGDR